MAHMNITVDGDNIEISCDQYDWTSLTTNGTEHTQFPASGSGKGSMVFNAHFTPGSPASNRAPMILNTQKAGTGESWVGLVTFKSDGNNGCYVDGIVHYYKDCQTGENNLQFSANGLTGAFCKS